MDAWLPDDYHARILDPRTRRRHEAGCPNAAELSAYTDAFPPPTGAALVLGMTPELRNAAARHFPRLYSLDINPEAIALYRDWLDPDLRHKEIVREGDWLEVERHVPESLAAVLGDGVLTNLTSWAAQADLLARLHRLLIPGGKLITRTVNYPPDLNPAEERAEQLLARHRQGALNAAEFGYAYRIIGHLHTAWDPQTAILDSRPIFENAAVAHRAGQLTDAEYKAILRYRYLGRNCFPTQAQLEGLLAGAGFRWRRVPLHGRDWYRYMVVYVCEKFAI